MLVRRIACPGFDPSLAPSLSSGRTNELTLVSSRLGCGRRVCPTQTLQATHMDDPKTALLAVHVKDPLAGSNRKVREAERLQFR